MTTPEEWAGHQKWEAGWWGDCTNTYGEETKQLTYAHRMGLKITPTDGHWPVYDLAGKSVLDLGGGVVSMLLKTINGGRRLVVDPILLDSPNWVQARYARAGIDLDVGPAESEGHYPGFDECWIYNVLQHVMDPEAIVRRARLSAKLVRIFEWIDIPPHQGHPHELKAAALDGWLGGTGNTEQMNENGCVGRAYYGAFPGAAR